MNKRWLASQSTGVAAAIQPTFTPVELACLQTILAFALNPANAKRELMLCLDAAGTLVHDASTGRDAAPVTETMRQAVAGGGVRFWHNHPSQDSLSAQDWFCASVEDVEVLAMNARGSVFIGRVAAWDERLTNLLNWLPRLSGDLELHVSNLARQSLNPTLTVELHRFTGHITNLALAATGLVQYAYCLAPEDGAMLAEPSMANVLAEGQVFAKDAIDDKLKSDGPVAGETVR